MEKQCVVARHEEGITLNPYEYLKEEDGSLMVFDDKQAAIGFLKQNDISDEEIESYRFFSHDAIGRDEHIEVE